MINGEKSFIPKRNMKCTMYNVHTKDNSFFSQQMSCCLLNLLVYIYGSGLADSLFGSCLFRDLTNMKVPSVVFIPLCILDHFLCTSTSKFCNTRSNIFDQSWIMHMPIFSVPIFYVFHRKQNCMLKVSKTRKQIVKP